MCYINKQYEHFAMGKTTQPGKSASSRKRSRPEESPGAPPPKTQFESDAWEMLLSINAKLSSFDSHLSVLEVLLGNSKKLRTVWNSSNSKWKP